MSWAARASKGGLFGVADEVDETSAADADIEDVSPDVVSPGELEEPAAADGVPND